MSKVSDSVTVRFAPSPTGYLHLGSARTALFNYLFARRYNGRFLLRIEDTDRVRSEDRFLEEILSDLRWLGIGWDTEPVFQSQRFEIYRQKAATILASKKAYKEGDAVIFSVEKGRTLEADDMIHGPLTFSTDVIKDQVMIKSDGSPTYNFACVVDDAAMGITHILRGDDHISNIPKQLLFYEALGESPPRFGHMPLILGQDGAKLSKRHGGVSVEEYRKEGFLPEALVNHLILLGWFPGEEHEVLTLEEAVNLFEIKGMGAVQAKFDMQKLRWLNAVHIMKKTPDELLPLVKEQMKAAGVDAAASAPEVGTSSGIPSVNDDFLRQLIDLYKIRMKTVKDFVDLTECFFTDAYAVEKEAKKKHLDNPENRLNLRIFAEKLASLTEFTHEKIEEACRSLAEEKNLKPSALIHPARVAISGRTAGAGLFEMMELLGREKVLERMRRFY